MSLFDYTENGVNGGHQRCVQEQGISGERVFVDIVKDIKVRSSRVKVTFNPTDRVLRGKRQKRTQRRAS